MTEAPAVVSRFVRHELTLDRLLLEDHGRDWRAGALRPGIDPARQGGFGCPHQGSPLRLPDSHGRGTAPRHGRGLRGLVQADYEIERIVVCVVGTSGNVYAAGDTEHEFSIMSVPTLVRFTQNENIRL